MEKNNLEKAGVTAHLGVLAAWTQGQNQLLMCFSKIVQVLHFPDENSKWFACTLPFVYLNSFIASRVVLQHNNCNKYYPKCSKCLPAKVIKILLFGSVHVYMPCVCVPYSHKRAWIAQYPEDHSCLFFEYCSRDLAYSWKGVLSCRTKKHSPVVWNMSPHFIYYVAC